MVSMSTKIGKSSTLVPVAVPVPGPKAGPTSQRQSRSPANPRKSPMPRYYVRIGALAEIHHADGPAGLQTGRRVIVRTHRGAELGQITAAVRQVEPLPPCSTRILRPTTDQDELLLKRLERHKRRAVEACRNSLREAGSASTLLDVDQIFDGGTLLMHFLGPVDEIAQSISQRIVEEYESVVRSRHFAKLLRDGCGPGCGTEQAAGCSGSSQLGGCSQCGLSQACPPRLQNA